MILACRLHGTYRATRCPECHAHVISEMLAHYGAVMTAPYGELVYSRHSHADPAERSWGWAREDA